LPLKNLESVSVKKLDIRGKLCPMTFVYTKLKLEEMVKDEILEVVLDFEPALKNIPDSCKRQNLAEVLDIEDLDENKKTWKLVLRKL
jgi:tRNA 2-thiouridine synthesizing protein A